jgi:hypothetical protein
LAYGRTLGWAYNANKWSINAYGGNSMYPFDNYFDMMKIFHLNKPVNPATGTRDPTISSNSWGFRATIPSTGFYYFRQGTTGSGGVAYTGVKPEFMRYIGQAGDGERVKGEMVTNNLTTAGDELIASGVIFVGAAGNGTQQAVKSDNPNFNNYWSYEIATPLATATHTEFGSLCYNTVNRRGFPQQLGKFTDGGGNVVYPVINIGALDDEFKFDGFEYGKEWKVSYSDMGDEVDCYAPGNDTLSACRDPNLSLSYPRWDDTYSGSTIDSFDQAFNGTSSACPVAAGLIATLLENNRSWGWADVKAWLATLPEQPDENFYQGPDPQTATSTEWADLNSLAGGLRRVIYSASGVANTAVIGGAGLSIGGSGISLSFD